MTTRKHTYTIFLGMALVGLALIGGATVQASISGGADAPPAEALPEQNRDAHTAGDPQVTYEDVLVKMHSGQWFGWTDSANKNYENLVIHNPEYSRPSKAYLDYEIHLLEQSLAKQRIDINVLESKRRLLEYRFKAGTHSDADVVEYLRLLGGF